MKSIAPTESVSIKQLRPAQIHVTSTAFLSLFSLVGLTVYGLPLFYDFFVNDLGWSRARVTSGNAFGKVIVGPLFGFVAGWFIDRFGPRRLMLAGIVMGGLGVIGLSRVNALWMFYACYLFIALGYVCGGPLPCQVMLSRWFDKARSKAMGIAYIGIGVGGAVVPLLAAWLVKSFNWHQALVLLGILMIFIPFPFAWFVRESPETPSDKKATDAPQPISHILKKASFYLLAIGSFCSIGAVGGANQHLKLFLSIDQGYSQTDAAKIISLVLFSSIFGRLLMGWLADRFPKKYVMLLIYLLVAAAIPLLYLTSTPRMIYVFAVIFGIGLGGDYMIIPLMAAELFGVKVLGRVMGIILTADGMAEALSPMFIGWLYDQQKNYTLGFAALIAMAVIGAMAIALLPGRTATKAE
jgi:MFS family permease